MSESTGYSGPSAYQIASEVRSQLQSELNAIQNNISITNNNVQIVNSRVDEVDEKVLVIYREMLAFIREQRMANRLNQAETRIGTIRQELEKKYGHYGNIRRTVARPLHEWRGQKMPKGHQLSLPVGENAQRAIVRSNTRFAFTNIKLKLGGNFHIFYNKEI